MKHSLVYYSKLINGIYLNEGNSLAKITWYIVYCLLIGKKNTAIANGLIAVLSQKLISK